MEVVSTCPDGHVDLIYIDPPFNTGRRQERAGNSYQDSFDDYMAFLKPRLLEACRMLAETGSIYVHLDCREVHYVKVLMDQIFGRDNFVNEIIWAYDYGGRSKTRWPAKHDNILLYSKTPDYYFDFEEVERIPYMAPGLVGPEKAAAGKTPTSVWWHTIVSPTGKEKTGYPTQKPLGILKRIVAASCPQGGLVCDFFAGSGTAGVAALELDRRFVMIDNNPEAFDTMRDRFNACGFDGLGVQYDMIQ
jgi:site-specific DNA-methyltransferase (adenine-specific)